MSPPANVETFSAVLEPLQNGLNWVVARVPFSIAQAWPVRRGTRVCGEIEGVPLKTSLMAFPGGSGHFLLVNRKIQAAANVCVGSQVQIWLQPDLEERPALIPPELERMLKQDRKLRRWFGSLGTALRRDVGKWVTEPKSEGSRQKRAEQAAEWFLLTMEGEAEAPPILRAAFLRQPLAQAGWDAMTPAQRRGHLLGIFHLKSGKARDRRAAKAVEDAVTAAKRKKTPP
jgi:uncharacterized protein YdeI (YjbR/CyaY-like superfamily)